MLHSKLHSQHRDRFYLDPPIRPLYPRLNQLTVTYTVVTKLYVWQGRWWFIGAGTVKQTSFQWRGSYASHPGMVNRIPVRGMRKSSDQDTSPPSNTTLVVWINNLRSLLAFAVQNKLIIHQTDVTTAFLQLHGCLEEDIYTEQPPG